MLCQKFPARIRGNESMPYNYTPVRFFVETIILHSMSEGKVSGSLFRNPLHQVFTDVFYDFGNILLPTDDPDIETIHTKMHGFPLL